MPRINPISYEQADSEIKNLFDAVKNKFGMVPNIMATMAHSPAVLQAYMSFGQALGDGILTPLQREQIALAAAGTNNCVYCASAHNLAASGMGQDDEETQKNLQGQSSDPKTAAMLAFVRRMIEQRGWVEDADLDSLRDAGYQHSEVAEIIANVALNLFTNYFNHVAETELDFPEVKMPAEIAR